PTGCRKTSAPRCWSTTRSQPTRAWEIPHERDPAAATGGRRRGESRAGPDRLRYPPLSQDQGPALPVPRRGVARARRDLRAARLAAVPRHAAYSARAAGSPRCQARDRAGRLRPQAGAGAAARLLRHQVRDPATVRPGRRRQPAQPRSRQCHLLGRQRLADRPLARSRAAAAGLSPAAAGGCRGIRQGGRAARRQPPLRPAHGTRAPGGAPGPAGARAEPVGRRRYWPIFEAAERLGKPIAIHSTGYGQYPFSGAGWLSFYIEEHHSYAHTMQTAIISMVMEGVFERFPNLKLVAVE